jgi:hypothetical protein
MPDQTISVQDVTDLSRPEVPRATDNNTVQETVNYVRDFVLPRKRQE